MSNEWRTDEPEVGTVAFIHDSFDDPRVVICSQIQGKKVWNDGFDNFRIGQEWLPITTPEERRLRQRVRELEDGIKLHKGLMEQDEHEIYAADEELWRLIDKQEGGGDVLG